MQSTYVNDLVRDVWKRPEFVDNQNLGRDLWMFLLQVNFDPQWRLLTEAIILRIWINSLPSSKCSSQISLFWRYFFELC